MNRDNKFNFSQKIELLEKRIGRGKTKIIYYRDIKIDFSGSRIGKKHKKMQHCNCEPRENDHKPNCQSCGRPRIYCPCCQGNYARKYVRTCTECDTHFCKWCCKSPDRFEKYVCSICASKNIKTRFDIYRYKKEANDCCEGRLIDALIAQRDQLAKLQN